MENEIKIGSVVCLKSNNNVSATVSLVGKGLATCYYVNKSSDIIKIDIPLDALSLIK